MTNRKNKITVNNLILLVAGLFQVIPGISIMNSTITTPPDLNKLFGGIVEAFGIMSLLLLWLNKSSIRRLSRKRLTRGVIILGIIFIFFLSTYYFLFNYCVVSSDLGTVYFPIVTRGEIDKTIKECGSRYSSISPLDHKYGIDTIRNQINKMPSIVFYKTLTTTILLISYLTVFLSMAIAFGLIGFYMGDLGEPGTS